MLNRYRLSVRISALGLGLMLAFSAVTALLYPRLESSFYAEKREKTRNLVESASSVIEHYAELEKAGNLTRAQAQAEARRLIATLNYDGSNYFWINDLHPTMVMHPVKPELDGKDLSDLADPNGKRLFVEMVKVARAEGSGFVDYYWPKPGQEEPAAKISFVKLQPEWGWIVGSGIYVDDVQAQLGSLFLFVFGTLGVLCVVGWVAFVWFARSISRPLERVIGRVDSGSAHVQSATGRISSCSRRLAEEATHQTASLADAGSALEEMGSMTAQNAEHSTEAAKLMQETRDIVIRAVQSMQKLTEAIAEVTRSSEETSKVVKTIDEIAFQTNILALNAAVEAARAGEAGAGFAVVADEVRALAQRAAQAARNTGDLIEDTVRKIGVGSDLVTETADSFSGVEGISEKLHQLVAQISTATQEQARGAEAIGRTVADVDRVTQQNAAIAQESAYTADQLREEVASLHHLTEELTRIVRGHRAENPQSSVSRGPKRSGVPAAQPASAKNKAAAPSLASYR